MWCVIYYCVITAAKQISPHRRENCVVLCCLLPERRFAPAPLRSWVQCRNYSVTSPSYSAYSFVVAACFVYVTAVDSLHLTCRATVALRPWCYSYNFSFSDVATMTPFSQRLCQLCCTAVLSMSCSMVLCRCGILSMLTSVALRPWCNSFNAIFKVVAPRLSFQRQFHLHCDNDAILLTSVSIALWP